MQYKLMNFNIPTHLKKNLDLIANYKHISRTSILNRLLDLYCRQELKNLEDNKRIQDLITSQTSSNKFQPPSEEDFQAVRPMFDDDYDWEERFKL